MTSFLSKLLPRKRPVVPCYPIANSIRRYVMTAPASEGAKDRLLESRLRTFGDNDVVQIYASDIRIALNAARNSTEPHPDRFRLEYDWNTGGLRATDGREHLAVVSDGGLLAVAAYILGRVRDDDRRRGRGTSRAVHADEVDAYPHRPTPEAAQPASGASR